jgi:hypothetical protein
MFIRKVQRWNYLRPTVRYVRQVGNLARREIQPPAFFQDIDKKPPPFHQLTTKQNDIIQNNHKNVKFEKKMSILDLFRSKNTRSSTWKLFSSLVVLQIIIFYISSNAIIDELDDSETKLLDLWRHYEIKDISQTVMAVHIGQLKQQLINAGIKPVTPQQALTVSQHLLSFARDQYTGNLMIYVDPKSQIYKLVPFSYEYDIQKIPKLNSVIDQTWDEYNKGTEKTNG